MALTNQYKKGIALMLAGASFYCFVNVIASQLGNKIPVAQVLTVQNGLSLLLFLPFFLFNSPSLKTPFWKAHLIRDFTGLSSYYLLFLALRSIPLVDATTLHFVSPFFVPIIAALWFKEKFSPHIWWSLAIGFCGISFFLHPSWQILEPGVLFALIAALLSAVSVAAVRYLNLKNEPIERILFYLFAINMICSLPISLKSWVWPSSEVWILLTGMGLFALMNQLLITRAFRYGPAFLLAPFSYSAILYAGVIDWAFFQKIVGIESILGAFLIVLGGCWIYIQKEQAAEASTQ